MGDERLYGIAPDGSRVPVDPVDGLDLDHDVPADVAVGNDRQLWRLDDDVWHSEPLRPTDQVHPAE